MPFTVLPKGANLSEITEDIGKLEEGARCLYGKIIRIWDDPTTESIKWIVIQNDSVHSPKNTFSIYRHRSDDKQANLSTWHFIPASILKKLSQFCPEDFVFGPRIDPLLFNEEGKKAIKKGDKKGSKSKTAISNSKKKEVVKKSSTVIKKEKKISSNNKLKSKAAISSEKSDKAKLPFRDIFSEF